MFMEDRSFNVFDLELVLLDYLLLISPVYVCPDRSWYL